MNLQIGSLTSFLILFWHYKNKKKKMNYKNVQDKIALS